MAEKYIFRGNIALPTRKSITLGNFSDPVPPNHITDGSVFTINIIISYLQKALIKSGRPLHKMVLNTLGVASDGCNRLRCVGFVDTPDLDDILLKMM